jgi:hypothetical protein
VNLLILSYNPRPGSDRAPQPSQLTTKSATTQSLNQGKKSSNQIHQLAYQKYSDTAPNGVIGRKRRRDRNYLPQKYNSIQN